MLLINLRWMCSTIGNSSVNYFFRLTSRLVWWNIAHMKIIELRKSLSLSQEAFAKAVGLKSRGYVCGMEGASEPRCSVRVALEIELLSGGRIRASALNSDVALVRDSPLLPAGIAASFVRSVQSAAKVSRRSWQARQPETREERLTRERAVKERRAWTRS